MREQLQTFLFWILAQDPTLTFDQRLSRWVNVAAAGGFVVTVGTWVIGWLFNLPWFVGLLLGLVVWVVLLNGLVAYGRRTRLQRFGPNAHLGQIRIPTAESFNQLQDRVEQLETQLQQSEQEREQIRAERDALEERVEQAPVQELDQLSDEDLKEHCRELAEDLHQFLDDYALDEADRAEWSGADFQVETARADTETMRQFRTSLKPRVMGMLAELKRRGWWKEEDFDLSAWEAVESIAHPHSLQLIANRLERLGYGL